MWNRLTIDIRRSILVLLMIGAGFSSAGEQSGGELTSTEVRQWADDYFGRAVSDKRVAGLTIAVVQNGQLLHKAGYGYCDYGNRTPVDPETSGFIVGSVTKTFIATGIGQLIDRGAITSFDDPANKYLERVQLPGERGARVTIRHLLNHRAGFADVDFGFMDKTAKDTSIPLSADEIRRFMPDIVMEPGGRAVYSNWSFSLLGFLIEDLSGQRLDEFLRENIWAPLGMTNTSMVYGQLPANLCKHHVFEKGGSPVLRPQRLPHPWIGPAGTIVSTATDMVRYMNAHIFRGADGGEALMSGAMFDQLHSETYRNASISLGFAHTFWTGLVDGATTIEHGGGAPGFQTMMVMIPDKQIGYFVSMITGGLAPWASFGEEELNAGEEPVKEPFGGFELREAFVNRFFPPIPAELDGPKTNLHKLVGKYWQQRRPFNTVEILGQAFNPAAVLTIEQTQDGRGLLLNGEGPFRDIGNGVFTSPTGLTAWNDPYSMNPFLPAQIAFGIDEKGEVIDLVPGIGDQVWVPVSSIWNPQSMLILYMVFGCVVVSGALLVAWPQSGRWHNATNYLGLFSAMAVVTVPYAIFGGFDKGDSLFEQMAVGEKSRFWIMIICANALAVAAAFLSFLTGKAWLRATDRPNLGWSGLGYKLHATVVTLSVWIVLTVFGFFNFLGVNLPG